MARIDPEVLKQMKNSVCKIEAVQVGNMIGFKGPWLGPDAIFESFSEALRENAAEYARREQKKAGLNETWQTPEQAKQFEARKKVAKETQKKAAVAAEMALQNK